MTLLSKAAGIMDLLIQGGASNTYIVGGFVRDQLLQRESKDIDIEVFGISYQQLLDILKPHYPNIDIVGKSFGTCKIGDIEVSIPRKESRKGPGHKDFDVELCPDITPKEAASRRDFTINAMMMDKDGNITDPFNGTKDITAKTLRMTSKAFSEDSLRVMRAFQFVSRFGFEVDRQTQIECQRMLRDAYHLPSERLAEEWRKWTTGDWPGEALLFLRTVRWTILWPALHNLVRLDQDRRHHPEGDAYTHTQFVVEHMASITKQYDIDTRQVLLYTALLHDVGKAITTVFEADDSITSYRHDQLGVPIAEEFLNSIHVPQRITKRVLPLIKEHMAHLSFGENISHKAVRKLAVRLHPATIQEWSLLLEADSHGRPPLIGKSPGAPFITLAKDLKVDNGKPQPLIDGDTLKELGWTEGIQLGNIHKALYQAQINGRFTTKEEALEYIAKVYNKRLPKE